MATTTVTNGRSVVRHVRPVSAMRMAFAMALSVAAIFLVGFVALFLLASASGALDSVGSFLGSLGLSDTGKVGISLVALLPAFVIVSAIGCVVCAALGGALAVLYNNLAEVIGGVEVVTRDR